MKRLRWYDYLTLNLFWFGLNIRNTALGSIFMPYLVGIFVPEAVKNSALGGMRAAGLVIAMLVQPAAGLLSDRSMSRFGRRRPYILIGAFFDLVFLALIAVSWNYWSLLIGVLLIQFSSNISHGPLQGLIPDLVPEDERGRASAIKAIFELLPIIIVGLTIAKLVGAGELGWAVFATGATLLIVAVITVLFVKEEPLKEKPNTPFWPPMLRVLGMLAGIAIGAVAGILGGGILGGLAGLITLIFANQVTALEVGVGVGGAVAMIVAVIAGVWAGALATLGQDARRQSSFTWWIVNRLMFLAAATSLQGSVFYFVMYAFTLNEKDSSVLTGSLTTVIGIFILFSALASGWLADRIGRKRLVGISGIVAAVGNFLLLSTIWIPNLTMVYISGTIIGLATGLFMTANWALGTDLVPAAEAGRYLGISNLAGAGAGIVGAGIGGLIADYLNGYRPGLGYFAVFASYAVLFALSAVSLIGVREAGLIAESSTSELTSQV
ncbi:MAG: MFS transporter [Chloroflexi bacterium]|nr:MFS transporter [Chloroflexota bacterium]